MDIPFLTNETYDAHYPVNMYFHPEGWNGKPALIPTDGLLLWRDIGKYAEVRSMYQFSATVMYAIVGDKVYKVTEGGQTELSGALGTSTGIVHPVDDGVHIMFVDGLDGWYIVDETLTQITDADFVDPIYTAYMDGFFLVIQARSDYIWKSALRDPSSWDGLDNTAAERFPDKALAMVQDHTELPVFGEKTVEFFYNSGDAVFPLTRKPGYFVEQGIGAPHSLVKLDQSLFWLADDWTVRRMVEYTPVIISKPDLNTRISKYLVKSDAIAFGYTKSGNAFYVITFPTENVTWQYNAATQQWNQLAYSTNLSRHRANCYCYFLGKHLVGDYANGKIYELDYSIFSDDSEIIVRKRVVPQVFGKDRENLFFNSLELVFKPGVGLVDGQGSDPQSMLRWSDDGLRTFSNEHWEGVGKIGEYTDRSRWQAMGMARERIFEWSATDPVEWVITNANLNVTAGRP